MRVFAAHDWGVDGDNHRRVASVVHMLRATGLDVWLDEDDMSGNILSAMCHGIDTSQVVLVFVTRAYLDKVEKGKEVDNVRREFMYAARNPEKMLAIRFDPHLPKQWPGPVGMVLGSHLYCNMAEVTDQKVDELRRMIDAMASGGAERRHHHQRTACLLRHAAVTSTAAFTPPPPPPRATNVKARVRRLVELYGSIDPRNVRTAEIVDQLFASVVGEGSGGGVRAGLTMLDKIQRIEAQLAAT